MLNLESTNLDLSDMDSSVLYCVNPYDVNPIGGAVKPLGTRSENNNLGRSVKLEMEEFGDLAPFLGTNVPKAMSSFIDELNTPVFDQKGPFDFMVSDNAYIDSQAADPFTFEYEIIHSGNSVLSNKKLGDSPMYSSNMSVQLQEGNNSELVNIIQGSEANLIFAKSESDQENIYIINNGYETPVNVQSEDQISATLFKFEDTNSVVSVNSNDNQDSNVSSPSNEYSVNTSIDNVASPSNQYCRNNFGIETPEDSNSSLEESQTVTKKVPKLKLTLVANHQPFILNTPDVIDSVVDFENRFNIIDYVNDKDLTTVNIEDVHFEDPSTSREFNIKEIKQEVVCKTRKRRNKREEDDEDYVPPSKKHVSKELLVYSSDCDSEAEMPEQNSKRGRPSKRTFSISSDHSDASKYRELRDKNNEASRKSRLKRKIKDLTLQKEADELYERNVKLKAQVEEYEKMVNNFRSNLFKILLKK